MPFSVVFCYVALGVVWASSPPAPCLEGESSENDHCLANDPPHRVTFISVNDVYKLVGLPSDLSYWYLNEDFDYVNSVGASACDGKVCGSDVQKCGLGPSWEACFPMSFDRAQQLPVGASSEKGVRESAGPCRKGETHRASSGQKFGGLVDFAATFKWLKEDSAAAGDLAIGTFAGDYMGPSFLAESFHGKQLIEVMNHMGVDLVNIGNHDIDFKLPALRDQMQKSAFHYLNANLLDAKGDADIQQPMLRDKKMMGNDFEYNASEWRQLHTVEGSEFGPGWAVIHKSGVRVCILGTTDTDKMNWAGKKIKATARDIPAALNILETWKRDKIDCTLKIAITHTRTGNDINLFRAVELAGFHLDAIIGGHDHYAAFAELKRTDGGITYMVKTGADAVIVSKLSFDVSGAQPHGQLEIVPVLTGACNASASSGRNEWFQTAQVLSTRYAKKADDANAIPLNVRYQGVYDTSIVRDDQSLAINMWLDFMRESLSGDLLFFQAGLVRQDMSQDWGATGMPLSMLFMLEEFPWGDEDPDARSSLFPFEVSVQDLVTITLPFVARSYWCKAPFNDANRIHASGIVVEMTNEDGCDAPGSNPIHSITYVGNCHQRGVLQDMDSGCCTSPVCGRWWSSGDWDARVTTELKSSKLTVLTGQFCVPSKYGSHGGGFHDAGMLCRGAESESTWGSGSAFAKSFEGRGVLDVNKVHAAHAHASFTKLGYLFKRSVRSMLQQRPKAEAVGSLSPKDCEAAARWYDATSFLHTCLCEVRAKSVGDCGRMPKDNGFPRFYPSAVEGFQLTV